MDDEEVYYDNNQLHQYLSSFDDFAGCYDVIQLNNHTDMNVDSAPVVRSKPRPNCNYYSIDNKTLSLMICKILESGLLLDEDAQYTEGIAEPANNISQQYYNLSQYKNKALFIGSAFLASVFFCSRSRNFSMPCSLSVGIGLVTMSCGMWKYQEVRRKKQHVQNIDDLINVLHTLFQVLKKSTQLIQENEIIVRGNILAKSSAISFSSLPNHVAKCHLMISLRSAISVTIERIVCVFAKCTKQLIHSIPLAGQLNFHQSYIATLNSDPSTLLKKSDDLPLSTLRHNHNIYLLLQSEFLKHLVLCLCPKLWLHEDNCQQFQNIKTVTCTVIHETNKLNKNLQKEYIAFNLYGLNDNKKPKTFHDSWNYSDIYVATHSAGLHLQTMLLKVRAVEELLEKSTTKNETDNFLDHIQNIFNEVLSEKDLFESCCKQSLTQVRKLKVVARNNSGMEKSEEVDLAPQLDGIVEERIFKCDNYVVEDEVFEATSCQDDILREEPYGSAMLSKEERIQREIERQISWRMVKELKTVLVSKATEWKERERRALLRKAGLDTSTPERESSLKELSGSVGEWPLPRLKKGLPKKYKSNYSRPTRRHSTIGFGCSSTFDQLNKNLPDTIASLTPVQYETSSSKELSPLKEMPCNIGEWPLPRLKKGLPKKFQSNYSSRRHSTIGFECSYSLDGSSIDLSDGEASLSSSHYKPSYPQPSLPDLSPPMLPSQPTQSIPVPPLPPPPMFLSSESTPLSPLTSPQPHHLSEDNVLGAYESVNDKEVQSGLDSILKGAELFWNLKKKPIEDTFCGTGENVEEDIIEPCVGEN